MKRAVRWIGIGITAAAAATMLFADMVLADGSPQVTLRFDILSPSGVACSVPGHDGRGRDLMGKPHLLGVSAGAQATCTAADGRSYVVNVPRDPRDPLAVALDVIVLDRAGRPAPLLLVQANSQQDPLPLRGSVTALAPAVR